jgi:hypothetical protein
LLVARTDEPDVLAALVQSIEQFVCVNPGNAEDPIDSVIDQRAYDSSSPALGHFVDEPAAFVAPPGRILHTAADMFESLCAVR